MKKKVLLVLLCMAVLLAGCGSKSNDVVATTAEVATLEETSTEEIESVEETSEPKDEEYGGNDSAGDSAFTMTEESTEEETEEQIKFNDALEESLYNLMQEGKTSDLTYEQLLEVYGNLKRDASKYAHYKYVHRFVGVTYENTTIYDEPVVSYKLYAAMSDDNGSTEYPYTLGVTYWSNGSATGMMGAGADPCVIPAEFMDSFTNTETWYDHVEKLQEESMAAKEAYLEEAIAEYDLTYDWQKDYMKRVVEGTEPYTIPDIQTLTYGINEFCSMSGIDYDKVKSVHQDDRDGEMIDDDGNHVYQVIRYVSNESPSTTVTWVTLREDGTFIKAQ